MISLILISLFLILYCRGGYFGQSVLEKLKRLRASISEIAKDFAKRANMAEHAQEANELLEEGMKQLENLFESAVCFLCIKQVYIIQVNAVLDFHTI